MDRYNGEYDDIIGRQRPLYEKRAKMPMRDRAAQFAPFAALTGFDSKISETARLTDKKPKLSEEDIDRLNGKVRIILENIGSKPEIEVIYFVKDLLKSGGSIESCKGRIRKIDLTNRIFIFEDCKIIPADDIIDIRSALFDEYYRQIQGTIT